MGKAGGGVWCREHTDALNHIAKLVHQRIRLGLVDMTLPARVHVDADATDCSIVLVQGEGDSYRVAAMLGRELTVTERAAPVLERLLLAAAWGVRKLSRYTLWLPRVTVMFPDAAAAVTINASGINLRLQARILDL